MSAVIAETPGLVRLHMTPRLWQFFRDNRISFGGRSEREVRAVAFPKAAQIERYADFTAGNHLSTMGAFSYRWTPEAIMSMGRYCSIAEHVRIMGERHAIEHATTSNFPTRIPQHRPAWRWARDDLLGGRLDIVSPTIATKGLPTLGHDVWIGNGALLQRGITLGHGCVVAAGAVVVKDVPPYSIVGGNPARVIRLRFSELIIERFLASRWWDLHPSIVFDTDIRHPEQFLDRIADAASFNPGAVTWKDAMAAA